jgi:hypothetical protein
MTGHFSDEALDAVEAMFAEGQKNLFLGQCNQKKLREQNKQPRTPEQEQADQARSQALRGKSAASGNRSESAKKAAQTRRQCKGQTAQPETGVK